MMAPSQTNTTNAHGMDPLASYWLGEDNADPIGEAAKKVFLGRYESLHIAKVIEQKMRVGESRKGFEPQQVRPS